MSVERDRFLRGMAKWAKEERTESVRPALVKGRRMEANTDLSQVAVRKTVRLRNDAGTFVFTLGYSVVGGPDVLP